MGHEANVRLVDAHAEGDSRDDKADAGTNHGRQLVTKRLAAARRHEHQRVPAGENCRQDFLLASTELRESENVTEKFLGALDQMVGSGRVAQSFHNAALAQKRGYWNEL